MQAGRTVLVVAVVVADIGTWEDHLEEAGVGTVVDMGTGMDEASCTGMDEADTLELEQAQQELAGVSRGR